MDYLGMAQTALMYLVAGIGCASLVLQGVALITGITHTTKDDELVGKFQGYVLFAQKLLARLALNK